MIGEALVEIFVDDVRLRHDDIAVDQRRDYGARVELDVPVLLMLAGTEIEMPALPIEAFLSQHQPHLLGAARHVVVVKRERHGSTSLVSNFLAPRSTLVMRFCRNDRPAQK
jgi:hypothetical protein